MTDPQYADLSLASLRHASERGTTHKHRLMAWAADRIDALEAAAAEKTSVTITMPEHEIATLKAAWNAILKRHDMTMVTANPGLPGARACENVVEKLA